MTKKLERIGRRVAVNARVVEIPKFSQKTLDELEEMKVISLKDDKPINFQTGVAVTVGMYALASGLSIEEATEEINKHLRNGGSIDRLTAIVAREAIKYEAPLQR